MEELLNALQRNDKKEVERLAKQVLMTRDGKINMVEVDRFEAFAPCHIAYPSGTSRGIITYGGRYYFFG